MTPTAMTPTESAAVTGIAESFGSNPARLLDIIAAVQHRFGHVGADAVSTIAARVGLHAVEVETALSFYAFFDAGPRGHYWIRLSRTPVSLIKGAEAVARAFEAALGVALGETTADGLFTVQWTSDIGMGDQEPAALVNGLPFTLLKPEDVPGIVAALRGCVEPGPSSYPLDAPAALALPNARVRPSLAQAGPLLTGPVTAGAGIKAALAITPDQVIETITKAKLLGRGGAGFPTGLKWRLTRKAVGVEHYIVCNADEGEPGTFKDRVLLSDFPDLVIEGMAIAGLAVGASKGYVYVRSEYPHAIATLTEAISVARRDGVLDASFDIEVRTGAGAYVCGEETSLLESLEGKRGMVRAKPPLPAHKGLFGRPTVINNVISLASVPVILAEGAEHYQAIGFGRSRGTLPIQLAGNIRYGGLFEAGFGMTLGDLVETIGGGTATGRPVRAVQVGGPLGAYFPPALFDTPFDYEAFTAAGGLIGHGGIVVFDDSVDMARQARFAMEFCAIESCGKCTPCRIGSTRGVEVIDKIIANADRAENTVLLTDLCDTMKLGSLCALGGFTPYPVMSALTHFPEDFGAAPLPMAAE